MVASHKWDLQTLKSEECFIMHVLSIKVEECLPGWQGMNTDQEKSVETQLLSNTYS